MKKKRKGKSYDMHESKSHQRLTFIVMDEIWSNHIITIALICIIIINKTLSFRAVPRWMKLS